MGAGPHRSVKTSSKGEDNFISVALKWSLWILPYWQASQKSRNEVLLLSFRCLQPEIIIPMTLELGWPSCLCNIFIEVSALELDCVNRHIKVLQEVLLKSEHDLDCNNYEQCDIIEIRAVHEMLLDESLR